MTNVMVNQALPAAKTELQRLAALTIEIERLAREFQPVPDKVMDCLMNASFTLEKTILEMQPAGVADVGAMLRMLGARNADDEALDPNIFAAIARCGENLAMVSREQFAPANRA